MIAVAAPRLCAICADRPATVTTEIDGRDYRACTTCALGPAVTPSMRRRKGKPGLRDRILRAIEHSPGATAFELRIAMAMDDAGANSMSYMLIRMVARAEIVRAGHRPVYRYWIAGSATDDDRAGRS